MCEKCGCSDTASHGHDQGPQHVAGVAEALSRNDRLAERNRGFLLAKQVRAVNLLSFPRSNGHALVTRTVAEYGKRRRMAVLSVADLEKMGALHDHHGEPGHSHDARPGESVVFDAHAVGHLLAHLELDHVEVVLIENAGSAACQAVYDLGETARVAVFSVFDGELKPLKFPLLFANARAVVINEMNNAGVAGFDVSKARANVRQVAPDATVLEIAPETGVGMDGWYGFLDELVKRNGK